MLYNLAVSIMQPTKKQLKKKKRLSIRQIEVDTNTDDATIIEMLAEDNNPKFKFPYYEAFVKKHNLRKSV